MMKRTLTYIISFVLLSNVLGAQSLSSPESMLWDGENEQFIVSNAANGTLQAVDPVGNTRLFSIKAKGSHGLCFFESQYIISCYKNKIYVSDRKSGNLVKTQTLPGAVFLNGICNDGKGNVYVTDFSKRVVFKVTDIVSDDIGMKVFARVGRAPNGIIYDRTTQQLILLTWGSNAEIIHFDMKGTVQNVNKTKLSNLEAIIEDGNGDFYVSSWVPGGVYSYNRRGLIQLDDAVIDQPTGLALNSSGALFVLSSNDTAFDISPFKSALLQSSEEVVLSAFPNPMSINSLITYDLPNPGPVNISVYDCQGNLVEQLVTEQKSSGKHQFFYDRGVKSSGLYFINIQVEGGSKAIAVTLVD